MPRLFSSAFVYEKEALTRDDVKFVHEDGHNSIMAFVRWTEQVAALCIVHFGESQWENDSYGAGTPST